MTVRGHGDQIDFALFGEANELGGRIAHGQLGDHPQRCGSQIRGETTGFPQIVYTCHLFGVLATRAVLDVLAGRPVRPKTMIDVNDILRPAGEQARVLVERVRGLLEMMRRVLTGHRDTVAALERATAELQAQAQALGGELGRLKT